MTYQMFNNMYKVIIFLSVIICLFSSTFIITAQTNTNTSNGTDFAKENILNKYIPNN